MSIKFSGVDKLPIQGTRTKTKEGYLEATSALTCVGVQYYRDKELGGTSDEMVGVYRGADTVFHEDTIKSARMKPITREHPDNDVDVDNYKDLSVGTIGENVERLDNSRLGAKIIITDPNVIKEVEEGTVETSSGYDSILVEESGEFEGDPYKYRFSGPMIFNHLAIVNQGRCGPSVKILDKGTKMNEEELKKFLTDAGLLGKDGKSVALSDEKMMEGMMTKMMENIMTMLPEMMMKMMTERYEGMEGGMGDSADDKPSDEDNAKAIIDAAAVRSSLIVDAAPLLGKDADANSMTDREILEGALKDSVKDFDGKSDDYLKGLLDSIVEDRKAAGKAAAKVAEGVKDAGVLSAPINPLAARKLK